MSMSANLHRIVLVFTQDIGSSDVSVLKIADQYGSGVNLFLPHDKAEAMAAAFNAPIAAPVLDQAQ